MKKLIFLSLLVFSFTNCSQEGGFDLSIATTGVGGSYAQFMIVDNFLYVLDNQNIKTLSLATPDKPELIDEQLIGERIESIFNLGDRLFIGSGSGLYIYTIGNDGIPTPTSEFSYDVFGTTPCDPVVATDSFAYVTLNTATQTICGRTSTIELNQLVIFDVTTIEAPKLLAEYPMHLPKGVGIDGKTLFLCDDTQGLKIFNVNDPLNIELLHHFSDFTAFDVIPLNGLLLVVGPENVYQFDYSNLFDVKLISTIKLEK